MRPNTDAAAPPAAPKPRFALFLATGFGIGYISKAPGTFGSLLGLALALLTNSSVAARALWNLGLDMPLVLGRPISTVVLFSAIVFLVVSRLGVWSASRVAAFAGIADPQYVVIDEVSGQHLTLLLGGGLLGLLNWKLLLAGCCSRVLYFFAYSIFGSRFPYGRRSHCPAAGGSWPTTGWPPFTPRWDSGS